MYFESISRQSSKMKPYLAGKIKNFPRIKNERYV